MPHIFPVSFLLLYALDVENFHSLSYLRFHPRSIFIVTTTFSFSHFFFVLFYFLFSDTILFHIIVSWRAKSGSYSWCSSRSWAELDAVCMLVYSHEFYPLFGIRVLNVVSHEATNGNELLLVFRWVVGYCSCFLILFRFFCFKLLSCSFGVSASSSSLLHLSTYYLWFSFLFGIEQKYEEEE